MIERAFFVKKVPQKTFRKKDILSARGSVTALTPRNERNGTAEISLEIFNGHGDLVMTSVTEAIVKRKSK